MLSFIWNYLHTGICACKAVVPWTPGLSCTADQLCVIVHTGSMSATDGRAAGLCTAFSSILVWLWIKHYGMKTCIFRSVDNNESPVKKNEWIQKVKLWSAFTLKRVWEVLEIILRQTDKHCGSQQYRENYLSDEFYCSSVEWIYVTYINGCKTFCMRFKIKAPQHFCWLNAFLCLKRYFYCELFAVADDARLHTV